MSASVVMGMSRDPVPGPLQLRLERMPPEESGLRRTFLRWSLIGWADTALLLYGLLAMVTKR